MHPRRRAPHCENRDRRVEVKLTLRAFDKTRDGEKSSNLEATLPSLGIGFLVGVGEQVFAPVLEQPGEKLAVPSLVDLAGVRRGRPVRDAAGADNGDPLGLAVAGAPIVSV